MNTHRFDFSIRHSVGQVALADASAKAAGGIRQPRGADAWGQNIIDTRKDECQGRTRPPGAYSPISGGILDTGPIFSGQGPSSTGLLVGTGRRPRRPRLADHSLNANPQTTGKPIHRLPVHSRFSPHRQAISSTALLQLKELKL